MTAYVLQIETQSYYYKEVIYLDNYIKIIIFGRCDEIGYCNSTSNVLLIHIPTLHHGLRNRKLVLLVQKIIDFGLVAIENDGKPFPLWSNFFSFFFFLFVIVSYVRTHGHADKFSRALETREINFSCLANKRKNKRNVLNKRN